MKNKYQEALAYIKHDLEHNDFIRYKNGNHVDKYHREILMKLVDKETPMKPLLKKYDMLCPSCNTNVYIDDWNAYLDRCIECGQKIDWNVD